jgi:hypothetical protein
MVLRRAVTVSTRSTVPAQLAIEADLFGREDVQGGEVIAQMSRAKGTLG